MKLTQQQLIAAVKAMGADVELVDDDAASTYDLNEVLEAVDGNRSKILQPKWEQEHGENLTAAIKGEQNNRFERMLKNELNTDIKQFKDGMLLEEKLKIAIAGYKDTLQGEEQNTAKKIQELIDSHKSETESLKETYEAQVKSANDKYIGRDMKDYVSTQLKDIPLNKKMDRDIAMEDFYSHLQNKYHLSYDEAKKAVGFFDKANNAMPVLKNNMMLDLKDEAKEFFTPRGAWETDTRNEPYNPNQGQDYKPVQPNNGQQPSNPTDYGKTMGELLTQVQPV